MIEKLKAFENKQPEIIFSWKDSETDAEGWVVINSLRGGAAGGGTRMRKGLDLKEVISLAKTMEIKFEVSGPPIGGAKSGINFDPNDPKKEEVLQRWFKAVIPILKYYYGTGGDLHIDEIKEVIPMTSALRLLHPQEGIVSGHLKLHGDEKRKVISQLRNGVTKVIKDTSLSPDTSLQFTVADMITGYGVAMSVIHYYSLWGGEITNKKAVVQGFGNVGASTAYYLTQAGIKVIGILDRSSGAINKNGFSFEEIREFIKRRKVHTNYFDNRFSYEELEKQIWCLPVDIFVPAAGSRLVNNTMLENMLSSGLSLVSCGANVPFADPEIFLGDTALYIDNKISVIPDFIANCGMARVFAYLMKENADMNVKSIFNDVSDTIKNILERIYIESQDKQKISQRALDIVLKSIEGNK